MKNEGGSENAKYLRQWRKNNIEKMKAYRRKWVKANPEKMKECREAWKKKHPDLKKYYREYQRQRLGCIPYEEWLAKAIKPFEAWSTRAAERYHKDIKKVARTMLLKAVRLKRIIKPPICSKCKHQTEKKLLEGHHEDYSKWWEVEWLCRKCHVKIERAETQPEAE